MKPPFAFLVFSAAMLVIPIRAATPTTQPENRDYQAMKDQIRVLSELNSNLEAENQLLKNDVGSLRQENRRLLSELEAGKLQLGSTLKIPPFTLTLPPQEPDKNGKSFQFNGRTVYLEPLFTGLGTYKLTQGTLTVIPMKNMNLIDDRPAQK